MTSAKLAQMVENDRTHDHFTADQGNKVGMIAEAATMSGAVTLSGTATTVQTLAVPASLVRPVYVLAQCVVSGDVGARVQWSNPLSTDTPKGPAPGYIQECHYLFMFPISTGAARTFTLQATLQAGTGVSGRGRLWAWA